MLVAYITADREALFSIFPDPGKFYAADLYTFFFTALLVLVFGPGKSSMDSALGYLRRKRVAGYRTCREAGSLCYLIRKSIECDVDFASRGVSFRIPEEESP
jgi:hypothetical protein